MLKTARNVRINLFRYVIKYNSLTRLSPASSINVGVVFGKDDEHDSHGLSSDVGCTETKSPVAPVSGSSKADITH